VAPLSPVATCFMATGAPQCCFTSTSEGEKASNAAAAPAEVTDEESVTNDPTDKESTDADPPKATDDNVSDTDPETAPEPIDFKTHEDMPGISEENEAPMAKDLDEMYRIHVRCGHLSFSNIRAMARRGEVPG
jgi:hypothetical protein